MALKKKIKVFLSEDNLATRKVLAMPHQQFSKMKPLKTQEKKSFERELNHDLRNLIGIISQKCEIFNLGIEEKIYQTSKIKMEQLSKLLDEIEVIIQRGRKFKKENTKNL